MDVYPRFVGNPSILKLVDGANEMIAMPRATPEEYEVARTAAIGTTQACLPQESLNAPADVAGMFYMVDSTAGRSVPLGLTALQGARFLGIDSINVEMADDIVVGNGLAVRKFTREVLSYCFEQDIPDGGNIRYHLPIDRKFILSFFMTEYKAVEQEADGVDLVSKLLCEDRFRELVVHAENRLRYADDDDFEATATDVVREINANIPRDYYGMLINYSGRVYTYDRKTDEYLPTDCEYSDAWLNGSEVICIDGIDRVVIELGVLSGDPSSNTDDGVRVYILPEKQNIKRFDAYYCSDESEYELMDVLRARADTARSIIMSSDFARSNREDQVDALQKIIEQADDELDNIRQIMAKTGRVICSATRAVCLIGGIRNGTTHNDLIRDQKKLDGDIEADKIWVNIPELDMGDHRSFRGLKDFRYSDGEPVLYLRGSEGDLVYMVRLGDVESLTAI